MQIIVKKRGTEAERKKREAYGQVLQAYYRRECRDGSRFKTKGGFNKEQIRKVYETEHQ